MNNNTYVIIPAYNEGDVIGDVIAQVRKRFSHVICVNDGSRDDTARHIVEAGATLINHPINLGQGAALQTGIEYALQDPRASYFVTYDADGQHDLADVMKMLAVIKKTRVNVVLGSRFLGVVENIGRVKRQVLKMAIIFSNRTSGLTLTDTHNGLRVFDRHVAENLNITMPDFSHASEIIERIADHKFSYQEFPVTIRYTEHSRKKGQSMLNAINISFDILLKKVLR